MTKTVLITGASQGTGRATALLFARKGYNIVLTARKIDRLSKVANEVRSLGVSALAMGTDVGNPGRVEYLVQKALEFYGDIDVLVNNAGICLTGSAEHTTLDDWHQLMDTNYFGYVHTIHAILPHFLERKRGTIVNVGSFGGKMPLPGMAAYCASKYAVTGLTETLRLELTPKGIHICAVHPGVINSNFMERAQFRGADKASRDRLESQMAEALKSGFVSQPEDIAKAIWDGVRKRKDEVVVGPTSLATEAYRLFPQLVEFALTNLQSSR